MTMGRNKVLEREPWISRCRSGAVAWLLLFCGSSLCPVGTHGIILANPVQENGVDSEKKSGRAAEEPELFGALLQTVKDRYLMPERFDASRMFLAAVRAIEAQVEPLLASVEDGFLVIKVHDSRMEIPLGETRELKNMDRWAFRTAAFVLRVAGESFSPLELQQLMFGAMLETLDPHSGYFPPERFRGVQEDLLGEAAGIGVAIAAQKGYPVVNRVFPRSPALKAGMREGDVLLRIGGLELKNLPISRVERVLRGDKGSRADLLVKRKGWTEPRAISIVRAMIEIPSVEARYLGDNIGLCRIVDFKVNTPKHLERKIHKLKKSGMRGLVLDVRNNQGGIVGAVAGVADLFVDEGILLQSVGRDGQTLKSWEANRAATVFDGRVVVLVGPDTMSAGEILAASLQSSERAVVMGGRTWGKTTAQEIFHTSDGGGYRITTFQFQTPGGLLSHLAGVSPDIELKPMGVAPWGLVAFNAGVRESEATLWLPYGGGDSLRMREKIPPKKKQHVLNFLTEGENDRVLHLAADFMRDETGRKDDNSERARKLWVERTRRMESARIRAFFSSVHVDWAGSDERLTDYGTAAQPDEDGDADHFIRERDDLKLGFYADKDRAKAGEKVKLTFKISNNGTRTLYRCGGVLTAGRSWIDGREFVAGDIPPGESRKASVVLNVPFDVLSHIVRMEVELIVDERVTGVKVGRILEAVELRRPVFKYSVQLDDVETGNGNGLLEPGEKGALFLRLRNEGGIAGDVRVDAVEATDPLLVLQPRVVVGEMVEGSSTSVKIPVRFSRRDHKGPVEDHGSVTLVVYDRLLGGHVRAEVNIPVSRSSFPCEALRSTAGVLGGPALRGGASDKAAVVGTTRPGAVLNLEARCGSWFRISLGDGSRAFIHRNELTGIEGGKRGDGSENDYVPVYFVSPPEISATVVEKSAGESFIVNGEVSHEAGVKDVWLVTWSLDGDSRHAEKVFYKSAVDKSGRNSPGGSVVESFPEKLSFKTTVPVMGGSQFVGVVARNANDVKAVESLSFFEGIEKVKHEAEVGGTFSGSRLRKRSFDRDSARRKPRKGRGCGCVMVASVEWGSRSLMHLMVFLALFFSALFFFRGSGGGGEC